jgi:6-phosphogluconolactonase
MTKKRKKLVVVKDPVKLASYVAEEVTKLSQDFVKMNGLFSLALSGGSTPKRLYELLGKDPYSLMIPWEFVHLFWVDERCVPPDSLDSNYQMINNALLKQLKIPTDNIHRIRVELGCKQAVNLYQRELKCFFHDNKPMFDLVILGVGKDGHTASIFPDSDFSKQTGRFVSITEGNYEERPGMRVTLSLDAINSSKNIIFLVTGSEKAVIMKKIFHDRNQELPASHVNPEQGSVKWVIDKEAAKLL